MYPLSRHVLDIRIRSISYLFSQTDHLLGSGLETIKGVQRQSTLSDLYVALAPIAEMGKSRVDTNHLLPCFFVCSSQSHHDRYLHVQITESEDDALRDHVTPCQPPENVDKDCFDPGVRADDPKRGLDGLRSRLATGVEEVRAVPSVDGEGVDCVHR